MVTRELLLSTVLLEKSDGDYPASDWTVLAPNLTRSTDGVLQIDDPAALKVTKHFYRVRVMR